MKPRQQAVRTLKCRKLPPDVTLAQIERFVFDVAGSSPTDVSIILARASYVAYVTFATPLEAIETLYKINAAASDENAKENCPPLAFLKWSRKFKGSQNPGPPAALPCESVADMLAAILKQESEPQPSAPELPAEAASEWLEREDERLMDYTAGLAYHVAMRAINGPAE